ncbi:MAG: hypothetical protein HY082_12220 [Gammaproteobacteria bacterium]|nr:hypothetical protein [Gammaproteobacteria bacterium]
MFTSALKRLLRWAALALGLHGLWEVAQLPLYTLWNDPDPGRIARYVLHCLTGDVLIAVTAYLLTAIVFRDLFWPERRPWRGGVLTVATGLAFTAASEWYNVYVLGSWGYAPQMPTLGGIGLAPLLQWSIVPVLMILGVRRLDPRPFPAPGVRTDAENSHR